MGAAISGAHFFSEGQSLLSWEQDSINLILPLPFTDLGSTLGLQLRCRIPEGRHSCRFQSWTK